jgi:hypothetical protein
MQWTPVHCRGGRLQCTSTTQVNAVTILPRWVIAEGRMRKSVRVLVVLALSLVVLDQLVDVSCRCSALPERLVDVNHPSVLIAKLDRLRNTPGPKVVLVGDSLIHGGILARFGDAEWQEHGLGEQLAAELCEATDQRPFVINLGMDGALPADLEYLVPLVITCGADWVILDIHLRPFSSDFSPPDRQMSRRWLRELHPDVDGRVVWRPDGGPVEWLAGRLCDHSAILRNRMLIQEACLSTAPVDHPVLRAPPPMTDSDIDMQALVKLSQLKNRLRTVDLRPDDPQVAALNRVLSGLRNARQRHVVFYATENPALLADVMEPAEHASRFAQLAKFVTTAQGPTGTFVGPLPELQPEHFIDYTHLNAGGYRMLARRLAREIK